MKVFLSSVGRTLQPERDGLAAQLQVIPPYQPLRFEDFTAQGRSSRETCLAGVDSCDVYVLLLGPRYGDPLPDTGLAPTEEEFEHARRTGKTILVFVKETTDPVEPRQATFKTRVEDYVDGYFRHAFTSVLSLNIAVTAALAGLPAHTSPLTWSRLPTPAPIVWRWDLPRVLNRATSPIPSSQESSAPILDVHLIPVDGGQLRAVQMAQLPTSLTRSARDAGLFAETASVDAGSDAQLAWSTSHTTTDAPGGLGIPRRDETWRGIVVLRTGQVTLYESLPVDWLGTLVNQSDLQQRLARLIVLVANQLPHQVTKCAVAASLAPLTQVAEGDPSHVGNRNSGHMRSWGPSVAVMEPDQAVSIAGLRSQPGDVAAEMAAELLNTVRAGR